jgi:heparan-alpha-glucosaminide N-acetyltransferase
MENNKRILSIDIMRGLTLFLMLFVNDLYTPGVPKWLLHTAATEDGMGLADWVFPGFLFMVGLSIPFAFSARSKSTSELVRHILERTLSLLIIGIFMVNAGGVNAELTGISKTLWVVSGYVSIFLIWNKYPKESKLAYLKYVGILLLLVLAIIYRGGTSENPRYIEKGWWGILGLIGWGYFVAAFTYLFFRDHILKVALVWLAFFGLNILTQLGLTDILNPLKPIFGVVLDGNVPLIVISGLLIGILLKKYRSESSQFLRHIVPLGIGALIMAFALHQWFIISKIEGTPSWGMLCTGFSILLFALLFYLVDVKKKSAIFAPFKPAGENSLSTYLAPDIIYYLLWSLPFQVLFYKQDESSLLAVGGSIVWAFTMIGFAALLAKINIRLKL